MKLKDIKNYVDSVFGFDISEKNRQNKFIKARAMYYGLSKYAIGVNSYNDIADLVNISTHGSVMNGLDALESFLLDKEFRAFYKYHEDKIRSKSSNMQVDLVDEIKHVKKVGGKSVARRFESLVTRNRRLNQKVFYYKEKYEQTKLLCK